MFNPSNVKASAVLAMMGALLSPTSWPRGVRHHNKSPNKKAHPAKRKARKQRNNSRRKNR